ncbi:uncharacterized protein LOC126678370 [Mercurialis annua]|uniref:uncharacterized protein LOC126678370 n=1 Tax=Mercurialis annua TaxID=3986 RepID=UPI00215F7506|nr:uncharacterized protein LOC126678370 [Mercurialis annua]
MAPEKCWMEIDNRTDPIYIRGVDDFLSYAFNHASNEKVIRCPCIKCRNVNYREKYEVRYHLLKYGIVKTYTQWYLHGESSNEATYINDEPNLNDDSFFDDEMIRLVEDIHVPSNLNNNGEHGSNSSSSNRVANEEEPERYAANFYNLLREAKKKLHSECELSILAVVVKLLHLKSFHRWTNKSFDELVKLLREIIPNAKHTIPESYSSARKYISALGLNYEKYDVCLNHCTLYWGSFSNATSCGVCGLSRWKSSEEGDNSKRIPHKVLRYFPLKPRLQRLFMSSQIASNMSWHKNKRYDDGDKEIMRHPSDSLAWKKFDELHRSFASDVRNVRLGLATDGFQPFGNLSSQHSIWPVIVIPYNLPPWMCLKQSNMIMSMIIPGPHSPGMGIDIFLQPLISELKELWEVGVDTYDAHSKKNFKLHAAIMWTINDFPAYADLSGWSTKGYKACPCCHKHTSAKRLPGSMKLCYMDHRRFLPRNHKWRKNTTSFNGVREMRENPKPLTGDEVLKEFNNFTQLPFNRGIKRKYDASNSFEHWRKKSIFFELPYWKTLLIRHNLDVMHIEKNVCDSVLGTVMNIKGKTKDTLNSRYDLVSLGIRPELHPIDKGDKVCIPMARYTLSNTEKDAVCKMLASLKTPDGFLSKISRCVNLKEHKISGMKSHDYHVFIQRLLPLAIRSFLPKDVCEPLIELSAFFRDLCCKNLDVSSLDRLQKQINLTLCKLEMTFLPSLFDIMVHLLVHLPEEAKLAGSVQYRWMYLVERYLFKLKLLIRNMAKLEGSIAEGYIADECLTFCSRYLVGVDTKFNQPPRNDDGCSENATTYGLKIFKTIGRPIGKSEYLWLEDDWRKKAQLYILNNCEEVWPYVEDFKNSKQQMNHTQFMKIYNKEFPDWFFDCVSKLHAQGSASDDLLSLAKGPLTRYKRYNGYIVNGFRFHTLDRQRHRVSQNSGILSKGDDILVLKSTGYKVDNYSITSVKADRRLYINEPFILACHAEQIFYIEDPKDSKWLVIMKAYPRDIYNMPMQLEEDVFQIDEDYEVFQEEDNDVDGRAPCSLDNDDGVSNMHRNDVDGEEVPLEIARQIEDQIRQNDSLGFNLNDDENVNTFEPMESSDSDNDDETNDCEDDDDD